MVKGFMKINKKTENMLEIFKTINFQDKVNFELPKKGFIIKAYY